MSYYGLMPQCEDCRTKCETEGCGRKLQSIDELIAVQDANNGWVSAGSRQWINRARRDDYDSTVYVPGDFVALCSRQCGANFCHDNFLETKRLIAENEL